MTTLLVREGAEIDRICTPGLRGIGRVILVECLDISTKSMLQILLEVDSLAGNDGGRTVVVGDATFGWKIIQLQVQYSTSLLP